ncbi:hypothetical protein GEMRC1_006134 [Eukaryota sp. GEM-RC1]
MTLLSDLQMPLFKNNSLIFKILVQLTEQICLLLLDPAKTTTNHIDLTASTGPSQCLSFLLSSLSFPMSSVRWTSAQGIAQIVARISDNSREMIFQILYDYLNNSKLVEQDTLHGHLLSIAELVRKGLLFESHLPSLISLLIKFLFFDQPQSGKFIGSLIRDVTCFVFWCLTKMYSKHLTPFLPTLSKSFLLVSLFDREVSCRRAGSACFQELAGRCAGVVNGLEIITSADFVKVRNVNHSYLIAAPELAIDYYRDVILSHLLEERIFHWDENIRKLAADSIFKILSTVSDMDMVQNAVKHAVKHVSSGSKFNISKPHGSLILLTSLHPLFQQIRNY